MLRVARIENYINPSEDTVAYTYLKASGMSQLDVPFTPGKKNEKESISANLFLKAFRNVIN